MPKPTETDEHRFADLVPDDPRVETKPLFGNLGAFVNGNRFMRLDHVAALPPKTRRR